ncbi:MAG: MoaD/ThiS family protein [Deltaproteobacteria bacterium]|nr:MoaD/ThiS family protein [Deltaproteobacteria bacterium]
MQVTYKPNHKAMLMYISITFLGLQRAKAQTDQIQISLSKGTRVADLLAYIKECYPKLPFPDDTVLVAVNNKLSSMERVLKNNDNVTFLPFLGGG